MDIWSVDRLVIFIAFFIPGFITFKIYEHLVPAEERQASQSLIEAVAYSSINYALFSWLLLLDLRWSLSTTAPSLHIAVIFFVLFVSPVGLALVYWYLRNNRVLKKYLRHPIPKPWDYVFGKQQAYWIIVELTDGSTVGGMYDTESFASSYPMKEQIYLQEVWDTDGDKFVNPVERSKGALISEENIRCIKFYL